MFSFKRYRPVYSIIVKNKLWYVAKVVFPL
jgi:hypothetical protein